MNSNKGKQLLIKKVTSDPKRLFLIDGIGALLTAFSLGIVLIKFEHLFGMPITTLNYLALIACIYALYSITCHLILTKNQTGFLLGIITGNILYCMISIGAVVYHNKSLTPLGWTYFIVEIIIIIALVRLEWITYSNLKYKNKSFSTRTVTFHSKA